MCVQSNRFEYCTDMRYIHQWIPWMRNTDAIIIACMSMYSKISIWSNGLTSMNCYRRAADAQPSRAAEPRRAVALGAYHCSCETNEKRRTKSAIDRCLACKFELMQLIVRNASAFSCYTNTDWLGCRQRKPLKWVHMLSSAALHSHPSLGPSRFACALAAAYLTLIFSHNQWYVSTLFLCRKINRCIVRPMALGIVSMV